MIQHFTTVHTFASTASAEDEGIAALGIDPLAILIQAATFLVLFFLIQKLALKKIVTSLEERRKTINRGLHLTSEMDTLKADLDARVEKALKKARKDADVILQEARTESNEIIKAAEMSAGRKADALLRDASAKIDRDITQAKKDLKNEVVGLVTEVTGAVLREKVTASEDRKLTEKYLKEVL